MKLNPDRPSFIKGVDKGLRLLRSAKKRLVNGSNVVDMDTGVNFELRCSLHYKLAKIQDIEYLKALGGIIDMLLSELEKKNSSRT